MTFLDLKKCSGVLPCYLVRYFLVQPKVTNQRSNITRFFKPTVKDCESHAVDFFKVLGNELILNNFTTYPVFIQQELTGNPTRWYQTKWCPGYMICNTNLCSVKIKRAVENCLFDRCAKSASKFCIKRLILFFVLKLKDS